ncbi:MAG: transporter [Acidobacteria bacterium]|nr:transporter [Acidobacteriota bacterium]
MNPRRRWFWVAPCLLLVVSPAAAQTVQGLSPRTVLIGLGTAASQATGSGSNVGEVIADLVALQVSTAPIGSSAGGFTFVFDSSTRTFRRAASSLGPSFSERAITAGAGRANIGFNYLHSTYTSLDGSKLDDGSLQTIVFRASSGAPLYTGRMRLDMKSDTLVTFANVAMNDWFDVGIAVPYVRLSLSGSSDILEQSTGKLLAPVSGAASSSGFGDIALRAKARVYKQEGGGFAIGIDARIPTGDKEALIGSGVARTLVSGIWSATRGRFLPHASGGFEYWANPFEVFDPVTNQVAQTGRHALVYDGGVEFAASDRLTVNGELLGRSLRDGAALDYAVIPQIANPQGIATSAVARATATTRNQVTAAAGVKWNFAGSALISASVLLPMQDIGLRARITPVIGIDWGF